MGSGSLWFPSVSILPPQLRAWSTVSHRGGARGTGQSPAGLTGELLLLRLLALQPARGPRRLQCGLCTLQGSRGFRGALLASRDMSGSPSGPGGRGRWREEGGCLCPPPVAQPLGLRKGSPSRQTALLNAVLGFKRKGLEQSQHLSPWIFPS